MCISFGNPSEPCCGSGDLSTTLITDNGWAWSFGAFSWAIMPDGWTEPRQRRNRDFAFRLKVKAQRRNGRRLATLTFRTPDLPPRTTQGLGTLGPPPDVALSSVGSFWNDLPSQTIDLIETAKGSKEYRVIEPLSDPFGNLNGVWRTSRSPLDTTINRMQAHRWLQNKQLRLTFSGATFEWRRYDGSQVTLSSPTDTRMRSLYGSCHGLVVPGTLSVPEDQVADFAHPLLLGQFNHILPLHFTLLENENYNPRRPIGPLNDPFRLVYGGASLRHPNETGHLEVKSITWTTPTTATVEWSVELIGPTVATGQLTVTYL